jgi:hypothetical protein
MFLNTWRTSTSYKNASNLFASSAHVVWNPFFLRAGALLFDEKIHQNAAKLFWVWIAECLNS